MFQIIEITFCSKELCDIQVEDGIMFDRASIRAEEIRKEAKYAGMRVTLAAYLDGTR